MLKTKDFYDLANQYVNQQKSLYTFSRFSEKSRNNFTIQFSLFKFGYPPTILKFAYKLEKFIKSTLKKEGSLKNIRICSPPSNGNSGIILILGYIGKKYKIPIVNIKKSKPLTNYPTLNNKKSREKVIKNVFSFDFQQSLIEKKIIIIDDVIVTGSVLKEIAKELLKNKAEILKIYTILNLNVDNCALEHKLNEVAIYNVNLLTEPINKNAPITVVLLQALIKLKTEEFKMYVNFVSKLTPRGKKNLIYHLLQYTNTITNPIDKSSLILLYKDLKKRV